MTLWRNISFPDIKLLSIICFILIKSMKTNKKNIYKKYICFALFIKSIFFSNIFSISKTIVRINKSMLRCKYALYQFLATPSIESNWIAIESFLVIKEMLWVFLVSILMLNCVICSNIQVKFAWVLFVRRFF